MKELLYARYGLSSLQWVTRFAYSLFLGFCLASYVVMAIMGSQRTGFSMESIATYYLGNEELFALGRIDVEQLVLARPQESLLELTHFHLFSMPLMLFIQSHLFLLTTLGRRTKLAIVLAATLGVICDLTAPWLMLWLGPELAVVKILGRCLLAPAFLAFFLVPLWEMWIKPPQRARQSAL